MAYNGSDNRWFVETNKLENDKNYIFRVSAANSEGLGDFSNKSEVFHNIGNGKFGHILFYKYNNFIL